MNNVFISNVPQRLNEMGVPKAPKKNYFVPLSFKQIKRDFGKAL